MGVASVIRDYVEEMPPTFGQDLDSQQQKVSWSKKCFRKNTCSFHQNDRHYHHKYNSSLRRKIWEWVNGFEYSPGKNFKQVVDGGALTLTLNFKQVVVL